MNIPLSRGTHHGAKEQQLKGRAHGENNKLFQLQSTTREAGQPAEQQ